MCIRDRYRGGIIIGKKDLHSKNYLGDNEIFADIFNYSIYGGQQGIDPETLYGLDSRCV